jgi:6-phospho-3-hexuloisomerase
MDNKKLKNFYKSLQEFNKEVRSLKKKLDEAEVETFVNKLHEIDAAGFHTYAYGEGRSGLVARAFLGRLTNLGYNTHYIGDITNPKMREGDAVIYVSGSGETELVKQSAKLTKEKGAVNFGVTSGGGNLDKYCDYILHVPGRTKTEKKRSYLEGQISGYHAPLTPLGTLFEVNALIVLDSLIPDLAELKGIDEEKMRKRHFEL